MGRKPKHVDSLPVYQDPRRGTSFTRIRIGPSQYQTVQLGPTGSDEAKRRYAEVLAEWRRNGSVNAKRPGGGLTVDELGVWWLERAAPKLYREDSFEPTNFRYALRCLGVLPADALASDFGPRELKLVRDDMVRRGWSRGVINRQTQRLKTIWRRAVEDELVPATERVAAMLLVKALPPGTPGVPDAGPRQAAADADLERLLPELPPVVADMLRVEALTGMRPGEVRLLRTCDVDRSSSPWTYRPSKHKNRWRGQARLVAIGPRAQAVLTPYLDDDEPERWCFLASDGPYSAESFARAIARACDRAGVKMTAYATRHAFKMKALAAGDVHSAMMAMGQKSSAAFDSYGSFDLEAAKKVASLIG